MKTKKPYLTLRLGKLKKNSRDYKNEKRNNYHKYEKKFSADIPMLNGCGRSENWIMWLKEREKVLDILT